MSQNNYRDKVEAHRQSIEVAGSDAQTNPGRASRRAARNGQEKKNNNKLITILGSIFVLVPVLILVYFSFFANSGDKTTQDLANNDVNVQSSNGNGSSNNGAVATDDDKDKQTKAQQIEQEKAKKAAEAQEKAEKKKAAEEKAKKERIAKKKAAKEKAAKEKAAKEAAAKAAAQKAAAEKAAAEKAAKEKAAKEAAGAAPNTTTSAYRQSIQNGYLHNASAGDTVQSISIRYYGSTAKAAQIRQLNGLSSDKVQAGVKIALPMQ